MIAQSIHVAASKMKVNPALLHDSVRRMTRFNFCIHCDMLVRMRAEPYIMIAFSVPDKTATVLPENIPHFLLEFCHHAKATFSRRLTENRTDGRIGK